MFLPGRDRPSLDDHRQITGSLGPDDPVEEIEPVVWAAQLATEIAVRRWLERGAQARERALRGTRGSPCLEARG
jgi:hypothetical protein